MSEQLGKHVAYWRKFAESFGAGVSLLGSLDVVRGAFAHTEFDAATAAVTEAVKAGTDLSVAMAVHGSLFPRSVRTMVRAGEARGELDEIVETIADGLEDGSFRVPGVEGGTEAGDAATARTFRAFGRLLGSGVPLLETLEILAEEAPTPAISEAWQAVRRAVMDGGAVAGAMKEFPDLFAERVVDAVDRGERSGSLDAKAAGIADALAAGDLNLLPTATPAGAEVGGGLEKLEDAEPVVKLVNMIILEGIKAGATDIHVEPYDNEVKVRYRIDGVCVEKLSPPKKYHNAVVSRIKIMAELDIAERRGPQDGKIKINVRGTSYDLRVAVMPTVYGETVVMRVLRPDAAAKSLSEVISVEADLEKVRAACLLPGGLVLVTGVPGSGKSTLLYSMVNEIDRKTRSVVTIEDPVVYTMDDVQQIAINHKLGLTFALMLRCALRLDADVMVVGEVRDTETADVALKAAMAGRLVLLAMHTPTPVDTVTRLVDMGLPAYELNAALVAVISQCLVRKLCPKCRTEAKVRGRRRPSPWPPPGGQYTPP